MGHGCDGSAAILAVAHVPHHSVRNWLVSVDLRNVEAHAHSATAGEWSAHPTPHACEGEIIAKAGHAGLPRVADHLLHGGHLVVALRSLQENVAPLLHREVLYRGKLESTACEQINQIGKCFVGPIAILSNTPSVFASF